MRKDTDNLQPSESRRGDVHKNEAYLKLVGDRVRHLRTQLGMARKALSQSSGVSERYLAELERGTGNASLLVLRNIASALGARVEDLAREGHSNETSGDEQFAAGGNAAAVRRRPGVSTNGRIALIGLRGSGKTSLGEALSKAIGVPCIKLDEEIEKASGMEISDVLAVHGEGVYRRLERDCLGTVIDTVPRAIIKTGSGIVQEPDTLDLLFRGCFVIWITASADELFARAMGNLAALSGSGRHAKAVLEATLAQRAPLYARADAVVDTTGKSLQESLAELLQIVRAEEPAGSRRFNSSSQLVVDRLGMDQCDVECAS